MSQTKFQKAVEIIGALPKDGPIKPSVDDQLYFYKYFKQAKLGDNNTTRPGLLDFSGKAKWSIILSLVIHNKILTTDHRDAWTEVKGTTTEEAYSKYVARLLEILNSVNDEESKELIAAIEAA
ncbi:hypothetical protein C0991_011100 [Blastosporella zonata]|nr:hypothetical protein C0991_011100 [Blastosporella zonata]